MLLIKLIIVSFVCLVSGSYMKDGDATSAITINTSSTKTKQNNNNKKTTNLTAMKESNIYNIKRLIPAKAQRPIVRKTTTTATTTTVKTKNIEKPIEQQQQEILQQQESNLVGYEPMDKKLLPSTTTTITTTPQETTMVNKKMTLPPPTQQRKSMKTKKYKNVTKNSHKLNKKMLSKLGFTKVKAPNSHNRKRLAIESRRHASPDDSHMFIIKLPPNMYYYSNPKTSVTAENKAAAAAAATSVAVSHNSLIPGSMPKKSDEEEANVNGKKVSFPFNSNGKPGRIYHWNLPIIEKLLQDKQRFPNITNPEQLMDIKNIPTWSKPWENEAIAKSYGHDALANYKKTLKRKSPTYYAPANTVNKNSFNKYFSGNGKPKGFYVIKENHKKPAYYKHITA